MVPRARIELALPKKPDFESGASTNSATPAIFIIFTYQPDVIESGAVTRKYVPDIFNRIYPYIRLGRPVLRDTRASCTSSTNSAITCWLAGAQVYVNLALVKTSLLHHD